MADSFISFFKNCGRRGELHYSSFVMDCAAWERYRVWVRRGIGCRIYCCRIA